MLGGFFLAFIMLRNKITAKICGLGILQRALRIWPSYILAMMFYYSLFMRLGSGMMWSKNEEGVQACSTMWREILFMSNLIENG
jgi:peptidoglycan/LPS O-acetylase OafA/YrhL